MQFTLKTFLGTLASCLTNLQSYRILVRKPPLEILVYAAVLLVLPALISGGMQVYALNRLTASITSALQGNLPPLRIEKGKVQMEGESFRFEKENEYPPAEWRARLAAHPSATAAVKAAAAAWIEDRFPDRTALLKRSVAEERLKESPPENEEAARLLKDTANFGSFVFLVDPKGKDPVFSPGAWGFALSADAYFFNFPFFNPPDRPLKRPLPADTSLVVNDQTLENWRRLIVWQQAPFVLVMVYAFCFAGAVLFAVAGSLLAALTAVFIKCPLAARQVIALAVYALTPVVLFASLAFILPISLGYLLWAHVIIYGVYVVGAAKNCHLLA